MSNIQITVFLLTLGCARNEVDSEELAAKLAAGGFRLVDEPENAQIIMVNTCGFIEAAKADSINTILEAAELKKTGKTQAVVAVGCLAERYGTDLAQELPEADAVLGFDNYADIAQKLRFIMAGGKPVSHMPRDRRKLLPLAPVARPQAISEVTIPGFGERVRLETGPFAPLKIASGCDRRCSFCAIPSFRGAFVSRPISEVVANAQWLAADGVKEVLLVSENSSSYGKDWANPLALLELLRELSQVSGLERIRVSYLQPAEIRPGFLPAMLEIPKVVPYFDLSFQHAATAVLRRMRRHGSPELFLDLIAQIRDLAPDAGIRSNVIVGFPGETEKDFAELMDFISAAGFDALGVFGYSDEEGTEALGFPDKIPEEIIAQRVAEASDLAQWTMEEQALSRVGSEVSVLLESQQDGWAIGRALHQGPEDGETRIALAQENLSIGDIISGRVIAVDGVDLEVEYVSA